MNATAARLGSAPLHLDWTCLSRVAPIKSPTPRHHVPSSDTLTRCHQEFKHNLGPGHSLFYDAPVDPTISLLAESQELAKNIKSLQKFRSCLFIGIGGSSLGPLSLTHALKHRAKSDWELQFLENPDPVDWEIKTKNLNPRSTLVIVATKSGTTFETLALFLRALKWIKDEAEVEDWNSHFIFLTDPEKGELRQLSRSLNIKSLPIATDLGGRYSIFSPIALLLMELLGLDGSALLRGAKLVRDYVEKTEASRNILLNVASHLNAHSQMRPIHVLMPYSTRMQHVADWWVQLWSESLGKDGKGFTALSAVGANAQHSVLQLLRDGPDDKVTTFLTIDDHGTSGVIKPVDGMSFSNFETLSLLQSHSLAHLLEVEAAATQRVLSNKGRPSILIKCARLDEEVLGSLYFMYCSLTALIAPFLKVNPFDQPGVEEGKLYIRESLGRAQTTDSI